LMERQHRFETVTHQRRKKRNRPKPHDPRPPGRYGANDPLQPSSQQHELDPAGNAGRDS
jgi:hypothetical protein